MKVVVTGSRGFIGRHMMEALGRTEGVEVSGFYLPQSLEDMKPALAEADLIYHLAGVNRPQSPEEFETGNRGFTAAMLAFLEAEGRRPRIVFTSSTQATLDNPYGHSKRGAEVELEQWGGDVAIYRLTNVFGKWVKPNYNSVVGTFCHNIAHGLPVTVSDPNKVVKLIHIEDVVRHFMTHLTAQPENHVRYVESGPTTEISLGDLVALIESFQTSRSTLIIPDLSSRFVHNLYSTYLTYLEGEDFAYNLDQKEDPRGALAEFIKMPGRGQVFVSRTKPGVTRGNHYHHCKTEKFLVVAGEASIRFRHIEDLNGDNIIEHRVTGHQYRVIDIPPGYTHSIENIGTTEMVCLFWASEPFDPANPDTYFVEVLR